MDGPIHRLLYLLKTAFVLLLSRNELPVACLTICHCGVVVLLHPTLSNLLATFLRTRVYELQHAALTA